MLSGTPSRTARAAAAHRAAHQVLEQGRLFADPLALRILGDEAETVVREAEADPSKRRMRLFIAARTRFAEDALAAAVQRGVRQLVVLGAGLDTFAYRSPHGDRLRMFEVDHPATQAWKRQRLADAAIPVPDSLVFAPIDFESETLADGLAAAGFDPARQTFFTWLGVIPLPDGAGRLVDTRLHREPAQRRPRRVRLQRSPGFPVTGNCGSSTNSVPRGSPLWAKLGSVTLRRTSSAPN
jgi:methyltransferase (TIGR00027 family)